MGQVMTLEALLEAIKSLIEREAVLPHEERTLVLFGNTTDDVLGKVLEMKGGQLKIVINSIPKELNTELFSDSSMNMTGG
jgi:hypothetical protein